MQRDCQETLEGYLKPSRGNEMEARSNLGMNYPICIYYPPSPLAFPLAIFRSRTFFWVLRYSGLFSCLFKPPTEKWSCMIYCLARNQRWMNSAQQQCTQLHPEAPTIWLVQKGGGSPIASKSMSRGFLQLGESCLSPGISDLLHGSNFQRQGSCKTHRWAPKIFFKLFLQVRFC